MASDPQTPNVKSAVVIGAGPGGLMAAERLAEAGISVTVCERMPSPARKFLIAGRGGLNLTHSEPIEDLLARYGAAATSLAPAIRDFPAASVREWCAGLGVETFVGSSGRVFPRGLKASPLLRAWLRRLDRLGVVFRMRMRWSGFTEDGRLRFETVDGGEECLRPDVAVFALGGASWPRLGTDGGWAAPFSALGTDVAPLRPSNCGFLVEWSEIFSSRFAGQPLKRIGLTFRGRSGRGEAMVTTTGLEGGLVYAFSAALREAIAQDGVARPTVDLKPDMTEDDLARRLSQPRGKRSMSTHLGKAAGLPPVAIGLAREAGDWPSEPRELARRIKQAPVTMTGTSAIERAISSAGGVLFDEVDGAFMLKRRPGVFLAGEMLDWEAPTGGYLIHACLATGRAAGEAAARRLSQTSGDGRLAPIFASTSGGTPN